LSGDFSLHLIPGTGTVTSADPKCCIITYPQNSIILTDVLYFISVRIYSNVRYFNFFCRSFIYLKCVGTGTGTGTVCSTDPMFCITPTPRYIVIFFNSVRFVSSLFVGTGTVPGFELLLLLVNIYDSIFFACYL
jgi:hypothetical protein